MKEAIIVGTDGRFQDIHLVPDDQTGVTPLYEDRPPAEDGEEPTEIIVGYIVSEKVPEGLYQPRWDFSSEQWVEGLAQEEIDDLRNQPQPVDSTEQRLSDLELALADLFTGGI